MFINVGVSSSFTLAHYHSRECPGKVFADANVWLVSACIIAAFQTPVSRDELGEKVVPPAQFTSGFVRCVQVIYLYYSLIRVFVYS